MDATADREAFLREMANTAWELRNRELFDKALLLARKMGETDGTRVALDAVKAALPATRIDDILDRRPR